MEQLFLEFGLKDSIFVALFMWLLFYTIRKADSREEKLYGFLDEMKNQFAKLVANYEHLSKDVSEIKDELEKKGNDKRG